MQAVAELSSGMLSEPRTRPRCSSRGWRTSTSASSLLARPAEASAGVIDGVRVKNIGTISCQLVAGCAERSTTASSRLRTSAAVAASSSLPTIESIRSASTAAMCVWPCSW